MVFSSESKAPYIFSYQSRLSATILEVTNGMLGRVRRGGRVDGVSLD